MNDVTPVMLLTERQAAEVLGLTPRTLQQHRFHGDGPQFVRLTARAIRYRMIDIESFIEARLHSSTAEYQGGA